MNALSFDSKRCERTRQQLDSYLSNELLVETASEVVGHLETCEACSRDLEARMRVREALQRAVSNRPVPDSLRAELQRRLRASQPGFLPSRTATRWVFALAGVALLLVGLFAAQWWNLRRGEQLVANVLKLGVSDHVVCAIKGHNYPDVANPHEELNKKLGPQYAPLLPVVEGRLSGFQVLEAHICSVPGSPRKYVHFITRGRGTVLSVILTKRGGEFLPSGRSLAEGAAGSVGMYRAQLEGFNVAGFASKEYFGFVVSDLGQDELLQVATAVAPPLRAVLDGSAGTAKTELPAAARLRPRA